MPENSFEYRELRWADFSSYRSVFVQGMGAFERATGLDQTTDSFFKFFRRRSVWTLLALMNALDRPPLRIYVGVDRGQVVGTAATSMLPNAGYVFGVATDAAFRGRGIASHLLGMTHLAAQRKRRPLVALDVESDNETAVRLYRKLGYEDKGRSDWYVGPLPPTITSPIGSVTEVPRSEIKEVASWLNLNQLLADRDLMTPFGRMFTHHETLTQVPGAPPPKTWKLSSSGKTVGLLRGTYLPTIRTGFLFPITWEPAASVDSLLSLAIPAIEWVRSLEATRIVVVVPTSSGPWGPAMASLGLPLAVSTTLMVRPSKP
ncbi:MAG: GNAT family N-acetyltransferase [Thaumarchaeota archaeon]|nr:GNAT family N-acetyltransferase [Nitrososphaerota archaeon]